MKKIVQIAYFIVLGVGFNYLFIICIDTIGIDIHQSLAIGNRVGSGIKDKTQENEQTLLQRYFGHAISIATISKLTRCEINRKFLIGMFIVFNYKKKG